MPDVAALAVAGLRTGGVMFAMASVLMLPVVAALLMLNVGVGVVTRSAPQLNLFSVGFPMAIIAALVLLWLTAPQAGQGMAGIVRTGLELIGAVLTPATGTP
jgi:flagellar biosynthetic protein FliR